MNFTPRFRIRADGTFRGRERVVRRGRRRGGYSTYRFDGLITGRIGPDGIARGTISGSSRSSQSGFHDTICRL